MYIIKVYILDINITIKMKINMKKTEKSNRPNYKSLIMSMPKDIRLALRDEFLRRSGLPYPSFYTKLRCNNFRLLEINLMNELIEKYNKFNCE